MIEQKKKKKRLFVKNRNKNLDDAIKFRKI